MSVLELEGERRPSVSVRSLEEQRNTGVVCLGGGGGERAHGAIV